MGLGRSFFVATDSHLSRPAWHRALRSTATGGAILFEFSLTLQVAHEALCVFLLGHLLPILWDTLEVHLLSSGPQLVWHCMTRHELITRVPHVITIGLSCLRDWQQQVRPRHVLQWSSPLRALIGGGKLLGRICFTCLMLVLCMLLLCICFLQAAWAHLSRVGRRSKRWGTSHLGVPSLSNVDPKGCHTASGSNSAVSAPVSQVSTCNKDISSENGRRLKSWWYAGPNKSWRKTWCIKQGM